MTTGAVMFLLDAILVVLAWPIALWVTLLGHQGMPSPFGDPAGFVAIALYPAATLLFLYAMGLYRRESIVETRKALGRLPLAVGVGALSAVVLNELLMVAVPSWPQATSSALLFTAAILCFGFCGLLARIVSKGLRRHRLLRPQLLVVGAGARGWDLAWMLRKEGRYLSYDITFVHHDSYGPLDQRLASSETITAITSPSSVLEEARRIGASEIVVAPDERRGMDLESLIACKTEGFPVVQYLTFVEREIRRVDLKRMELSWVLYSDGFRFNLIDRVLKRLLDVTVSAVILALTAPFLLAAMAAVAIDDGFPVFYRQVRVTRGGRPFNILKLRTMRRDAEKGGAVWAAKADNRITRVGKFLRQTRLDELPQLFNVLRGDMSFVGPRPERPQFVEQLAQALPLYNQRHMVKAGLTGWAQINYPYGASVDDARSKLSYDLYYVKNFSVLFDLVVIVQTLRVVLWPSGVR
jgi:sugar transferase (PEP-CTERM system associated)